MIREGRRPLAGADRRQRCGRRVDDAAGRIGVVPSPDGRRVAFVASAAASGGRRSSCGPSTAERRPSIGRSADDAVDDRRRVGWSPDGLPLVFTRGAHTIRHEQTPAYSGAKIIYTVTENVPGRDDGRRRGRGNAAGARRRGGGFGGRRWIDARHFLFDRTSADFKRRTTFVVDIAGGEPKPLHEDVEEKFWSITGDAGARRSHRPTANGSRS